MAGLSPEVYLSLVRANVEEAMRRAADKYQITKFNAGTRRTLDRYLKVFLKDLYSTQPADEKFVAENICEAYRLAGLDQGVVIAWCDSPRDMLAQAKNYVSEKRRAWLDRVTPPSQPGFADYQIAQGFTDAPHDLPPPQLDNSNNVWPSFFPLNSNIAPLRSVPDSFVNHPAQMPPRINYPTPGPLTMYGRPVTLHSSDGMMHIEINMVAGTSAPTTTEAMPEESVKGLFTERLISVPHTQAGLHVSNAAYHQMTVSTLEALQPALDNVGFALDSALNSLTSSVGGKVSECLFSWGDRLYMLIHCAFLAERMTLEGTQPAVPLLNILRSSSGIMPYRSVCFVSRRPNRIALDEKGRLHDSQRPAMSWADGCAVYALRGNSVNRKAVEHPEALDWRDIRIAGRPAARRALLEQYGEARYAREHPDEVREDEAGRLYIAEWPYDERMVYFRCENATPQPDGTFETFWLRVPPGIETPRQAKAWSFGRGTDDFQPIDES